MNEELVQALFRCVLSDGLGLNLDDPNLKDTPKRIAKMYCRELFKNIDVEFNDFKSFPNENSYDAIIVSDNISFTSVCSHHFLSFSGLAWVLYIPDKTLVGASKMARLVEHYAARPQLQENLCWDIINRFMDNVKPLGAMVVLRAVHKCMTCRGVKQPPNAGFMTSAVAGVFSDDSSAKQEGFELIKLSLAMGG